MAMPSVASNPKEEIERPSYFGSSSGGGGGGPNGTVTLLPTAASVATPRCLGAADGLAPIRWAAVHRGRVTLTATSISVTGENNFGVAGTPWPGFPWLRRAGARWLASRTCRPVSRVLGQRNGNPTGCLCMCMLELQLGATERTAPKAPKPCLSVCNYVWMSRLQSSPFPLLRHVCALDITVDTLDGFSTNKSTIRW
jgi:hypothetical protein